MHSVTRTDLCITWMLFQVTSLSTVRSLSEIHILWTYLPRLQFLLQTNPDTSGQGRSVFNRIAKRYEQTIWQQPQWFPPWMSCSWEEHEGQPVPCMRRDQSLLSVHFFCSLCYSSHKPYITASQVCKTRDSLISKHKQHKSIFFSILCNLLVIRSSLVTVSQGEPAVWTQTCLDLGNLSWGRTEKYLKEMGTKKKRKDIFAGSWKWNICRT